MKKELSSGLVAGLLLYLIADFCVCLTCLDISDTVFSSLLTAAFVFCGVLTVLLFIRNRTSLKSQLLTGLTMHLAFWGLFIVDGWIGITRSFVSFPEDNYAGGMVLLFLWLVFTGIAVLGVICTAVIQFIRNRVRTK